MKKLVLLCCLIILFVPIVFGGILNEPPIPYDPNSIEFPYDPNKISFKLIGSFSIIEGEEFICNINYYDPDGDKIVAYLLTAPEQMVINATGETEYIGYRNAYFGYDWQVNWTPLAEDVGVHYIDIQIEDAPISKDFLSDTGTLVIIVTHKNKPPIIGGCTLN